ncbi:MAG: Maf family nucleotide pyrophosphatase [Cryomorphaceae bacterium]|jgi:septum formation protein|nr:Maf family nucleotide pyrophosphatase [Cryomorphaceae bacterium]
MKIILGSNSPRRKELLAQLGITFEVRSINFEEFVDDKLPYLEIPKDIAQQKLSALSHTKSADELIICADTLVFLEGRPLGKPNSMEEAQEMLTLLSGKTHEVITAVGIAYQDRHLIFDELTTVTFTQLTPEEIAYYINTYAPLDKAGSYGIQEWIGLIGVRRIEGSYSNVMGLPTHRLHRVLQDFIP